MLQGYTDIALSFRGFSISLLLLTLIALARKHIEGACTRRCGALETASSAWSLWCFQHFPRLVACFLIGQFRFAFLPERLARIERDQC